MVPETEPTLPPGRHDLHDKETFMPIPRALPPRTHRGAHIDSQRGGWVVALLILALTASQVFADADADAMRSRMRAAGYADAEVRNLIKSGALRDSSVRSAVIARGVPADALEPYVLEPPSATRQPPPPAPALAPPTPTAVTQAPPDSL